MGLGELLWAQVESFSGYLLQFAALALPLLWMCCAAIFQEGTNLSRLTK